MKRMQIAAPFLFLFPFFLALSAQARDVRRPSLQGEINPPEHVITVTRAGAANAKPDLGILIMTISSPGPLAEEAVAENAHKAKEVVAALSKLGYRPDQYSITTPVFKQGGGPYYRPSQGETTVVDASQYVYVFFGGPELTDVVKLTDKVAATIEALREAGAMPGNLPGAYPSAGGSALIVYTVKDSDKYEGQAVQQAVARAREAAQMIAQGMNVHITGVRSVTSSPLARAYPMRPGLSPIEGLPYRFYSTENDQVEIKANATVVCEFK